MNYNYKIYDKKSKQSFILTPYDLVEDTIWFDGEKNVWSVLYDATHEQKDFIFCRNSTRKDSQGNYIYENDYVEVPSIFLDYEYGDQYSYIGKCLFEQENQITSVAGLGIYLYNLVTEKYDILVESDEWDEFTIIRGEEDE